MVASVAGEGRLGVRPRRVEKILGYGREQIDDRLIQHPRLKSERLGRSGAEQRSTTLSSAGSSAGSA